MGDDKEWETRVGMAERVAARTSIERDDVLEVVDAWLEEVELILMSGRRVVIRGFGTFETTVQKPRTIINPTQGPIEVPAKRRIRFTPSTVLKEKVEDLT